MLVDKPELFISKLVTAEEEEIREESIEKFDILLRRGSDLAVLRILETEYTQEKDIINRLKDSLSISSWPRPVSF
jgi:hypothetical protein